VALPDAERDTRVDRWLGLVDVPEDGPELPRGCVPYWPCSVSAVLQAVERSELGPTDLVLDVGVGAGRTAMLLHALSGARVMGVEVQRHLAASARALAERCEVSLTVLEGDADDLDWAGPLLRDVTVFFLFCPFGGVRLTRLAIELCRVAEARLANANERCDLRVACVDTTLALTPTFVEQETDALGLTLYRCRRTPP
jgi:predicted RNA methylase